MKFLLGAKVSKRVMIHTIGHQRGLGTTVLPPSCFWRSPAHVQMPVHPSTPGSKSFGQGTSLGQRNFISEMEMILLALKGSCELGISMIESA